MSRRHQRGKAKKKSPSKKPFLKSSWPTIAICVGLLAITWIVFGQTLRFDFLNYDDNYYVYQNSDINRGFTWYGLVSAFTRPLVGNWHPLTSLSLMLDAQLFGLNPGAYHFVNLLLHSIAVLLLFFVFRAMTGATWRSAFVAALFAIHPLRAESVVWISERKDVLSGVFFFLALAAYIRYARKPPSFAGYSLVLVAFSLGLLAKAMLVTLPFVFLLLDYWPLRRIASEETQTRLTSWLLLEKVPLLLVAAAVSVATIFAQEPALEAAQNWPLRWRVENALVTIWIYVRQMFWPTNLAVFYPHPKGSLSLALVVLALAALLVVSVAVFVFRKKHPYLVTGWFWYLGMLVPVIGLVQVGWQGHADRYTYLPQIGLYLLIAWGVADLTERWRARRVVLSLAAAAIMVALTIAAWNQTAYWSSPVRLWTHTLEVTTNNDVAERGIGTALMKVGRIDEAIAHDRAALRIRPHDANGLTNLANALLRKKEFAEAIEHYRAVVKLRPNDSEVHRNLGKALVQSGAQKEGVAQFREALRIRPGDDDAAYSLGNILLNEGELDQAIAAFQKAIATNPKNFAARYNLALALQRKGRLDEAIAEFRQTLEVDPRNIDARNNLAIALLKNGEPEKAATEWQIILQRQPQNAEMHSNLAAALLRQNKVAEAIAEWRETLHLEPDKIGTEMSLAWILATSPEAKFRDGAEALTLAQRACQTAGARSPMTFRVLAAAFAETGRFAEAIDAARDGAQRAEAQGRSAVARLLQGDLDLYQQRVPLRDPTSGGGRPTQP